MYRGLPRGLRHARRWLRKGAVCRSACRVRRTGPHGGKPVSLGRDLDQRRHSVALHEVHQGRGARRDGKTNYAIFVETEGRPSRDPVVPYDQPGRPCAQRLYRVDASVEQTEYAAQRLASELERESYTLVDTPGGYDHHISVAVNECFTVLKRTPSRYDDPCADVFGSGGSATLQMPDSSWITSCVFLAMPAEKSVGSAMASSSALACSDFSGNPRSEERCVSYRERARIPDCAPPSTAESASSVVRMTLL